MRTLQLPRLMSRAKEMLHLSLKMRSLHFHTQTWQSWMTWSTGTFTLNAFFPVRVDYLWKYLDSRSRICASLIHQFSWNTSYWVRVWKKCSYRALWVFWKWSLYQGLEKGVFFFYLSLKRNSDSSFFLIFFFKKHSWDAWFCFVFEYRPRWVVPVLPKGELEVLLEAAIDLSKKGKLKREWTFTELADKW